MDKDSEGRHAEVIWKLKPRNPDVERKISELCSISPRLAALLVIRGIDTPEAATDFLFPNWSQLHSPTLLPDFQKAASAILGAKERGELIFIHGDYDVDGVTSTALFARFLTKIGANVSTRVPHRSRHGYGIHQEAVQEAHRLGAKLFLTCDCGTSAIEQVRMANELGMNVVVTDHHEVGEVLPNAIAVVNPHREDSVYPFPDLCGAGVVFKLCLGLTQLLGLPEEKFLNAFVDLAALGSIADVVPLKGENRVIVGLGLERLWETKKVGLQALIKRSLPPEKVAHYRKQRATFPFSHQVCPRLNAAGRIDDAAVALDLLMATSPAEAERLSTQLDELNTSRRDEQKSILDEAVRRVEQMEELPAYIVLADKSWHPGIVGIVAGALKDRYYRPALVAGLDPLSDMWKGSIRSIPGINASDSARSFPEIMNGGGHAGAAGASFPLQNLDLVSSALNSFAKLAIGAEEFVNIRDVDLALDENLLSIQDCEELNRLSPHGQGNPSPCFLIPRATLKNKISIKELHAKLSFELGAAKFQSMYWSGWEEFSQATIGQQFDLLVRPSVEDFRGLYVQMTLVDYKLATP